MSNFKQKLVVRIVHMFSDHFGNTQQVNGCALCECVLGPPTQLFDIGCIKYSLLTYTILDCLQNDIRYLSIYMFWTTLLRDSKRTLYTHARLHI